MGKLTKDQRREKRKRSRIERRKRRASKPGQVPWVAPKLKFFTLPNLFPDELSKEQRLEIVRTIGASAKKEFDAKYPTISTWFEQYDALYLLSFCAFYFAATPEGIDPEATGQLSFYHHYLEILQAFALVHPRAMSAKPLLNDASRLKQDLEDIGGAMQLRLLNFPEEIADEQHLRAYHLRTEMMMHTTAVRNWAYPHQMKRVILALAAAVRDPFKTVYGIDPIDLAELLLDLTEERNDLLNDHRDKIRTCIKAPNYKASIEAYNVAFPHTVKIEGAAVAEIWKMAGQKKRNLCGFLIAHADLRLESIYSFSLDHARSMLKHEVDTKVLEAILDRLSFGFGDLKDFNKEHIVLGNPVLGRPFIKIEDGEYFSAVWGVLPHFLLDIFEDLIWPHEELRNLYTEAKARFLEDEVERLFKNAFPNGATYRGSLWVDPATGKEYENDLTMVLDGFAVVVEAKSGVVTDPARRGAPKRLFETLRELIEEPSEQALRFCDYLQKDRRVHSFSTKRGETNVIDSGTIKYRIPLGVTFSHLGMIGSNLKKLIEARVVDKTLEQLAPSMSFIDLEEVFELLPLEVEKIHYFARRREFEAHMNYEGDEMDLLGFYLDNGFNIGDTEYKRDLVINMSLKSKELDPYFVGTAEGKTVVKPSLAMTQWWRDLLDAISARKTEGWVETGFVLLNSTKEDQAKFESMFKELMKRIERGEEEKEHNWVVFASGPERRRYLFAGYPYQTLDKNVRNNVMNEIMSDENFGQARGAVVIGVQMQRLDYPYSVLARRASTDLFDTLTLQ